MAIRSEENHMSLGRIKFLYEIESCIEVLSMYIPTLTLFKHDKWLKQQRLWGHV